MELNFNQVQEITTYTYDAGILIKTETIKNYEFLNTIYLLSKIMIPIIIFLLIAKYKRKKWFYKYAYYYLALLYLFFSIK